MLVVSQIGAPGLADRGQVFVANAGVVSVNSVLTETVEEWDRVLSVSTVFSNRSMRLTRNPRSIAKVSFCVTRKQVGIIAPAARLNFDQHVAAKQMIAQGKGGKLIAACSNAAYRPVRALI